jgi:hypothetical protein
MSQFQFDASQVAPQAAPEPVPADRYKVAASKAEMEPTKEQGQLLKLEWTILEGPFTGRKVYDRLNLLNKSEQAMQIAYGTLSAVCRAVGHIQIQSSTAELCGKPCIIDVAVRPAEGAYGPQNKITKYHSLSGVPLEQIGGMPGGAGAAPPPSWVPPGAAVAGGPPPGWAGAAPVLAPPPAAFAPVAPAAPVPIERLTAKANGATMEQFIAGGWTREAMLQQGYLEVIQPAPVAPPAYAQPAAPAAPAAPVAAPGTWAPPVAASAAAAPGPRPPWMPQQ